MNYTEEQKNILDVITSNESDSRVVTVNAVAGSGKTATCKAIIDTLKPTKGFYTAFNTGIVQDSKNRFGNKVEVKTLHALAYKYCKRKNIKELTYHDITESVSYDDKYTVIQLLDDYFRSSILDLNAFLEAHTESNEIAELVYKYAGLMLNNKIPVTFNFLLKYFQMLLHDGHVNTDFDLLMLDECQDITEVTFEIFNLINAKKKIMLGDTYQNIYSFMNTVNGFKLVDNPIKMTLTQSFRCSPEIAERVDAYGKKFLNKDFKFTGTEQVKEDETEAILSRTNASLISAIIDNRPSSYKLIRSVDEIFALPLNLYLACIDKPIYDKKFKYLETLKKEWKRSPTNGYYLDYVSVNLPLDIQVQTAINLIRRLNSLKINVFRLKEEVAKAQKPTANFTIATAHSYKGLEADKVTFSEDLNKSLSTAYTDIVQINNDSDNEFLNNDSDSDCVIKSGNQYPKRLTETLNLYYVAMTRAKTKLENDLTGVLYA